MKNDPGIKRDVKNTCLRKYGVESVCQNKEIREKQTISLKKTILKRKNEILSLRAKTLKEKYGEDVTNSFQLSCVKEKMRETNLKNRGCEYISQDENIKMKKKEASLKKYGVENPSQNEEVKQKKEETNLKLTGYKYSFNNPDILSRAIKNNFGGNCGYIGDLFYQCSYEKNFLTYFKENFPKIKIERGEAIPYKFKNKIHLYYPDFILTYENKKSDIVEIKGSHPFFFDSLSNDLLKSKFIGVKNFLNTNKNRFHNFYFLLNEHELYDVNDFDKIYKKYNKNMSK
jgi:hypothetical protein